MIHTETLTPNEHLEQFSPELVTAIGAVRRAYQEISSIDIEKQVELNKGGVNDFVTRWDTEGQRIIEKVLGDKFPHDKILGEESDKLIDNPTEQARLWVIDPIDGTANARAGRRFSFISLGFTQFGESSAGVVLDPYHNEIFYAEKSKGAYCNGRKIVASRAKNPAAANINTDMGFINEVSDLHMDMTSQYGSPSRRLMGSSIGAMLEVASGKADIFFYTTIKPWDNAAVFRILEESGAIVRGIDGRIIDYTSMDIVTGNNFLAQDFIERVGKPNVVRVKNLQKTFLEKNQKLKGIATGL